MVGYRELSKHSGELAVVPGSELGEVYVGWDWYVGIREHMPEEQSFHGVLGAGQFDRRPEEGYS